MFASPGGCCSLAEEQRLQGEQEISGFLYSIGFRKLMRYSRTFFFFFFPLLCSLSFVFCFFPLLSLSVSYVFHGLVAISLCLQFL